MIILNELHRPYVIDSLTQPLPLKYFWVFNAQVLDFMLSDISYIEEAVGPVVNLIVAGVKVPVPANWHVLVVDRETYTVDSIPVTSCAAFSHEAFVFSPDDGKLITEKVRADSWEPKVQIAYPSLEKAHAIIHTITPGTVHGKQVNRGIILSPVDLHRYVSNKTVGDILG